MPVVILSISKSLLMNVLEVSVMFYFLKKGSLQKIGNVDGIVRYTHEMLTH